MMIMTIGFSIAAVILLVVLAAMAVGIVALADRKLSHRVTRFLVAAVLSDVVAGLLFWAVCSLAQWWADVLWWLLLCAGLTIWTFVGRRHNSLTPGVRRLLPCSLFAAVVLVVTLTVGALLLWAVSADGPFFSHNVFLPVSTVLTLHVALTLNSGFHAYLLSLKATSTHRRYLVANGATHLESIMPSVRRALRASLLSVMRLRSPSVLVLMLLLFMGMLIGGVEPLTSMAFTMLLLPASLASTVMAVLALIVVADRWLFDEYEQPKWL